MFVIAQDRVGEGHEEGVRSVNTVESGQCACRTSSRLEQPRLHRGIGGQIKTHLPFGICGIVERDESFVLVGECVHDLFQSELHGGSIQWLSHSSRPCRPPSPLIFTAAVLLVLSKFSR